MAKATTKTASKSTAGSTPKTLIIAEKPSVASDIAKALGLSTSTVSRALRDSYEISPETKKIVIEYAQQINYRPNPIALSLKEKRSRSIGIIVCEIANSFFYLLSVSLGIKALSNTYMNLSAKAKFFVLFNRPWSLRKKTAPHIINCKRNYRNVIFRFG